MNLSPRQLRIIVALAGNLNFGRTAVQFNVTQPTLSKLVNEIEAELGVRLFERTTRVVRLTPIGQELLTTASRLVDVYEGGLFEIEAQVRRRARWLTVAALPSLSAVLIPEPIAILQREEPSLQLRVYDVVNDEAIDLLRTRRVDLVLASVDVRHQDFDYSELLREPYVMFCSAKRPVKVGRTWSVRAMAGLPFIANAHGAGARRQMAAVFQREGYRFQPIIECRNLSSLAHLVQAGCGVALLPVSCARLLRSAALKVIHLDGAPERCIGIITRRDEVPTPVATRFLELVREHAPRLTARR